MAQARKNKKFTPNKLSSIKKEIYGFLLLVVSILYLISIYTHDPSDPNFLNSGIAATVNNYIGVVGAYISFFTFQLFGLFSYVIPLILLSFIFYGFKQPKIEKQPSEKAMSVGLLVLIIATSCILLHFIGVAGYDESIEMPLYGGNIGLLFTNNIGSYIGALGTVLTSSLILIFSFVTYFDISLLNIINLLLNKIKYIYLKTKFILSSKYEQIMLHLDKLKDKEKGDKDILSVKPSETSVKLIEKEKHVSKREFKEKQTELFTDPKKTELPLLELLQHHDSETIYHEHESLQLMSRLLETNLKDFGIDVEVLSVKPGPVVTLFEVNLAKGTKVNQIINLSKDLARTMSVSSLRVVDNIPGTSSIGIEVPNEQRELVSLKDIIVSKEYEKSKSPLTIALGKDIHGAPTCTDLHKLPHLLVAGTTGSGKSVAIHSMLVSLLYKSDPSDLKMLLVDPKMLELSVYEGIPHLLNPVITDMKEASNGLRWCVQQMERRYRIMNEVGVRNIQAYNKFIMEKNQTGEKIQIDSDKDDDINYHEKLPFIVVVIDEFADMMLVVGKKVEDLITRLAQKARAAGIHLILATQRPSVNVITGIIKANIPARIALQVTTNVDSRTIIDSMGAEQLLGHGDMLFIGPGTRIQKRIHGAYVSDTEVKEVVKYLKKNNEESYIDSLLTANDEETNDTVDIESNDDPLYNEAVKVVLETKKTSISYIQRKLRIGYNRAANIIETMEARGILSEQQSNGNREIIISDN